MTLTAGLWLLALIPALGIAFFAGLVCGFSGFVLARQMQAKHQVLYRAFDPGKEKLEARRVAMKELEEARQMQSAYLEGVALTRDEYRKGAK